MARDEKMKGFVLLPGAHVMQDNNIILNSAEELEQVREEVKQQGCYIETNVDGSDRDFLAFDVWSPYGVRWSYAVRVE